MKRPFIVEQIRKVLKEVAPEAQTILYGSEARGDARPDSDIDLLVLLPGDKKTWDSRPYPTPFSLNVQRDGVLL